MSDLPENLFVNPVWHALQTRHRRFAITSGNACRYPADVAPFIAVSRESSFKDAQSLIAPGEFVWIVGEHFPDVPALSLEPPFKVLQMVLPSEVVPPLPEGEIVPLTDAAEMVALTDLAFPGFFRPRTCEMGSYYGVRSGEGELIAMGGERLLLPSYNELSAVCTHPAHRGKGYAANIMWRLVANHRREGIMSWLHVGSDNRRAIDLYLHMGFTIAREITLRRVSLSVDQAQDRDAGG